MKRKLFFTLLVISIFSSIIIEPVAAKPKIWEPSYYLEVYWKKPKDGSLYKLGKNLKIEFWLRDIDTKEPYLPDHPKGPPTVELIRISDGKIIGKFTVGKGKNFIHYTSKGKYQLHIKIGKDWEPGCYKIIIRKCHWERTVYIRGKNKDCDGISSITLAYTGVLSEPIPVSAYEKKELLGEWPSVFEDDTVTIEPISKEKLGKKIYIYLDDVKVKIHTSCSKPVYPGMKMYDKYGNIVLVVTLVVR